MPSSMRCSDGKGQDLVEFAIVLPVLLLMILGIIEFAIVIFSYDTIANAAREGARVGIIYSATEGDIRAAVLTRALALDLAAGDVTITRPDDFVRVEVNYDVKLMTDLIIGAIGGNAEVPLHTTATMQRE